MSTDELARWAVGLFETVGGPRWQDALVLGGVTAIVLILGVVGLILIVDRR